jgi:hypothetical protein
MTHVGCDWRNGGAKAYSVKRLSGTLRLLMRFGYLDWQG